MNRIILASASPRRKEILQNQGLRFEVVISDEEENINKELSPELYTSELALLKAVSVAKKVEDADAVIISADTVVYFGNEILEKPKDEEDAFLMLKKLSGKIHQVYTGICVMRKKDALTVTKSVKTDVKFKELSDNTIKRYLDTKEYCDKAGGYGIQSKGALLVEKIDGDYNNVVGLPLSALSDVLKDEFNIDMF